MTKAKTEFAANVADRLRAVEHAIDAAIADACLLTHDMTRHRVNAGFAAQVGHQALTHANLLQTALLEARSQAIHAHDRLAREARVMGIEATASGPLEDKPKFPGSRTMETITAWPFN